MILGLIASPIARAAAIAVVVTFVVVGGIYVIEQRAADRALQAVERANRESENRADRAEQNVLTCPPELWSREHQRCFTKHPH